MRLHVALIPTVNGEVAQAELNNFLASHRIASVDRQFINDGVNSAWSICVMYVDGAAADGSAITSPQGKKDIDYREVLPAEQFKVYCKLRDLRKRIAARDSVQLYAVFTNEQLAAMVTSGARTTADVIKIRGVGEARKKHVAEVLEILNEAPAAPATTSAPAPAGVPA